MMAGRNKKYTTDMLKMIVRQFRQEDTENKITVSRLINYSGIPKDVWYRNKEILDYIKQANFAPLLIKTEAAEIPSEHDIIKACGDDVEKYKEFIHSLLDTVASQEREIIKLRKDSEGIAKSDIEKLNEKIKEQEKTIKKLSDKLNYAISEDDRLINLKDNIDKTDVRTFSSQFGELFE